MNEILHSFACGIAFVVSVAAGCAASAVATKTMRREAIDHSKDVLAKLSENIECQKRIASAVETLCKKP